MPYITLLIILLTALVLSMAGCSAYPRYRTGAAEMPARVEDRYIAFTTGEYVRMGLILTSYLGKPYAGSSRYDPGVDCSLFTQEVFDKYDGTALPRTAADQFEAGTPVHRNLLRYADLVFFRTVGRRISHVGIYIGYNSFVHASSSQGVIISSMKEPYWAERYAGSRRILD